jgi:hypothetical protein
VLTRLCWSSSLVAVAAILWVASGSGPNRLFGEELSVHDVGEYAAVPWGKTGETFDAGGRMDRVRDLNLSVASINLNWLIDQEGNVSQEGLEDWARTARWGREQGKKLLPRVYFWDGNDRFTGEMRDVEVYWNRLDLYLSTTDPDDLVGICLAEENVWYAGREKILTELYHRIKAKYDIEVWQWWSPYSGFPDSGGWVPADGWVVDPYWIGKKPFRRYVRKYFISGKPQVVMPGITAALEKDKVPSPPLERVATLDQLDVAVEFNLPVAFYWIYGQSAGFGCQRGSMVTELDRINHVVWNYTDRVRQLPEDYNGLASADIGDGDILAIEAAEDNQLLYTDDFSQIKCIDDAVTMTGFRDLVMEGNTLLARGFHGRNVDASLVYQFAGDLEAHHPEVTLTAIADPALHGRAEVSVSVDGKEWLHEVQATSGTETLQLSTEGDSRFDACNQFWVRIRLLGDPGSITKPPIQIDDLKIEANLSEPAPKVVKFESPKSAPQQRVWSEGFQTNKYLWEAEVTDPQHLEWEPGSLAVRMRPGGSSPVLIWKVESDTPVENIRIDVQCLANHFLSTDHYLDVSRDGKTWQHEASTEAMTLKYKASGIVDEGLEVDLSGVTEFTGIDTFYVRLRPWTGSTVRQEKHRVHPYESGIIESIEVTATVSH